MSTCEGFIISKSAQKESRKMIFYQLITTKQLNAIKQLDQEHIFVCTSSYHYIVHTIDSKKKTKYLSISENKTTCDNQILQSKWYKQMNVLWIT